MEDFSPKRLSRILFVMYYCVNAQKLVVKNVFRTGLAHIYMLNGSLSRGGGGGGDGLVGCLIDRCDRCITCVQAGLHGTWLMLTWMIVCGQIWWLWYVL